MTMPQQAPPPSGWAALIQRLTLLAPIVTNSLPEIRNIISFGSGVAVAAGVMNAANQATLLDAVTHIGTDVADIVKYLGVIGLITMPILARMSASVPNLVKALYRKEPKVQVVAPPAVAAVTPAVSSTDAAVVAKVTGQEIKP